jgi:hypothetical protein
MTRATTILLVPLLLLAPLPVHARGARVPIAVQIEGYVGPQPPGVTLQTSWTVSVRGQQYRLHVATLRVLRGTVAYYNIISALRPYKVALQIYGSDDVLQALTGAAPSQKLLIDGNLRLHHGPGMLTVSSVRPLEAPPAHSPSD